MNGATWCDSQDSGANTMVLWNGCGSQTQRPGENLCRFNSTKPVCVCRERYPLPAVEQVLAQLSGAKFLQSWMRTLAFGK